MSERNNQTPDPQEVKSRPASINPAPQEPQQPEMPRTGDDLQDEPDAVDIGPDSAGTEETWHRAGGKSPPRHGKPPGEREPSE